MRLFAAASAAVFAYLLVGMLVGRVPRALHRRATRRRVDGHGWLRQAGVHATPRQFAAVSLGVGGAVFLAVRALSGALPVAVVPALATATLPKMWFARQAERRVRARMAAWPDGLRQLVTALEVPMSLHRALVELGRSGPEPLRPAWSRYERLAAALDQPAALEAIRAELADPVSDRVIEVLLVAHSHGTGVVADILRDLAEGTAEDENLLEAIETANLEKRIEARSAVVLPFAVLVLLTSTSAPYRDFYSSPGGVLVMVLGAAMAFSGMAIISRLGRLPGEERLAEVRP